MWTRALGQILRADEKSVLLLGPRQVGKSTLMASLAPDLVLNLAREALFLEMASNPRALEERILALQPRLQIEEANVRLEHDREVSPPFRVGLHLVIPGPDIVAEARDHTIRAAIDKVMAKVNRRITGQAWRRATTRRGSAPVRDGRRAGPAYLELKRETENKHE